MHARQPRAAPRVTPRARSPPRRHVSAPRAARPPLAPPPPLTPRLLPAQMSGRVLLMFVFFFQALYAENGGLHQIFTKPSFFGVVTGTRSPRRPHASHVAHPTVPAAALSLLSLSALVCVGFKTEWSALILTVTLGVSNIWMYPFWSPRPAPLPPRRARLRARLTASPLPARRSVHERLYDFYKYYFFQTLSVMGARPPAARRPQRAARRAARIAACPPVDPRASRAAAPSAAGDGRLDAAGAPRARRHLARPGRQKVDLRREQASRRCAAGRRADEFERQISAGGCRLRLREI